MNANRFHPLFLLALLATLVFAVTMVIMPGSPVSTASSVIAILLLFITIQQQNIAASRLQKSMEPLVQGRLSGKAEAGGSLKSVSDDVNQMALNTKKILSEMAEMSQKFVALASELKQNVNQTRQSSEEIANSISEVAEGATHQSEAADEARRTSEKMKEHMVHISDYADTSLKNAEEMMTVVEQSRQVFETLIDKMKASASSHQEFTDKISHLEEEAKKVYEITSVVSDISEKTNLLALNAAIEAARAGEQGRGFAVVADEVRKLAEQTASSTTEIQELIDTITDSIKGISKSTEEESEKTKKDIAFADESVLSFQQVLESTETTFKSIEEIRSLAGDTTSLAEETNRLMDRISESTENSAAFTQQVSAAAQQQSALMNEVMNGISTVDQNAGGIDDYLKNFIGTVQLSEKQQAEMKKDFDILKQTAAQLYEKEIPLEGASDFLVETAKKYSQFENIGLIRKSGRMVAATVELTEDGPDYSHRPYFAEALSDRDYVSEPYISNVSFHYCVSLAVPIKNPSGDIEGVLVGDLCIE